MSTAFSRVIVTCLLAGLSLIRGAPALSQDSAQFSPAAPVEPIGQVATGHGGNSAQTQPAPSSTAAAPQSGAMSELSYAERLNLKFVGQADLSGEYRLDDDGALSIPAIGRISMAGLSGAELEQLISQKATEATGHAVYATVEVVKYRPVYVTGTVNKPGAFEWAPGMIVLQAVAVSGGIDTSDDKGPGYSAVANLQKAIDGQKRALAKLARLQAEQRGDDDIPTPDRLVKLVGRSEADKLIVPQRAALRADRSTLQGQLAMLERGKQQAQEELSGLQEQDQRLLQQLALRQQYAGTVAQLREKGLVGEERLMEEGIRVSDLEEKRTNLAVARSRIQFTLTTLDREKLDLKARRDAERLTEIQTVEQLVDQAGYDISVAYEELGVAASGRRKQPVTDYRILRRDGGNVDSPAVTETTALFPGDVLVVVHELR